MKKMLAIGLCMAILFAMTVVPIGVSAMNVTTVSPNGGNIQVNIGEIALTFSEPVDPSSLLAENFSMAAGGFEVLGGVFPVFDSTQPNIVRVRFGMLSENASYTLTVSGVRSMSGVVSADVIRNYTTGEETFIYENFQNLPVGPLAAPIAGPQPPAAGPISTIPGLNFAWVDDTIEHWNDTTMTTVQQEGTNRFVTHRPVGNTNARIWLNNLADETTGNLAVEVRMRATPSTLNDWGMNLGIVRQAFMIQPIRTNHPSPSMMLGEFFWSAGFNTTGDGDVFMNNGNSNPLPAGGGQLTDWHTFRILMNRTPHGPVGFYYMTIYVAEHPEMRPFRTLAAPFTAIEHFTISGMYPGSTVTGTDAMTHLSHVRAFHPMSPQIISAGGYNVPLRQSSVDVVWNDTMNADSFGNVRVVNTSTGEIIPSTLGEYNPATRSITVNFGEFLDYDAEYEIFFYGNEGAGGVLQGTGAQSTFGFEPEPVLTATGGAHNQVEFSRNAGVASMTFRTERNTVSASGINITSGANPTASTTVTNNTNTPRNVRIILTYFDATGRLSAINSSTTIPVAAGASGVPLSVSLSGVASTPAGTTAHAFVLDVTGNIANVVATEEVAF